ncbi:conserved exported protein of unknown function [Sterolibacterium denitrificans]|uniref:MSHA biogenesis protein MshI n=1 Tax=Sterolibacterium denitrificans TaxID=157592 RepID=A0A7Z7MWD8_9PROT|nr:PilN domain-containing protein [Sterolibacterium denitrificans]SMB29886.1 conserved exported protein of unknown function [Sterolibacterium denitrificans]
MLQQINLINPALRKTRDLLSAVPLAMAVGVLLVLILVAGSVARQRASSAQVEADKRAEELKAAQAQLVEMSARTTEAAIDPVLAEELSNSRAMLNLREEVIATLERGVFTGNSGFAEFLRGFARQAPNGLWLTGFVLNPVSRDVEIRGRMLRSTALPEFIQRLKSEAVFRGVSFSSLVIERPAQDAVPELDSASASVSAHVKAASPDYIEFVIRTTPVETSRSAAGVAASGKTTVLEVRQ